MEIRKSLTNAIQLLGLLCLLFWSFTWNTPKSFDLLEIEKSFKEPVAKPCLQDVSAIEHLNKDSFVSESFKTVKYVGGFDWKVSTAEEFLLPPFNDWKEKEMSKQERNEEFDKTVVPNTERRKLNYASSKCGAKILASNKDSKHRISILNEKADEYMLNSCKINVWFVIELCDTIEATQIELANYELFSSPPKKFSVFSSSIYPTQTWSHLGTFEAKNQRTMQVFNLNFRNHSKFIKVIISSHHGKEHFCTLSAFRVVGYSMVYDYNEIIQESLVNNEKNISMTNETDIGKQKEIISNYTNENTSILNTSRIDIGMKRKWNSNSVLKICQMKEKYCNFTESSKMSSDHSACLFFKRIILKNETCCDDIWFKTTSTAIFNSTCSDLDRETNSSSNFEYYVQNNVSDDKNKKLNKHLMEFHNSSTSSKNASWQNTNSSNKNKLNRTLEILSTNVKPSEQNNYNLEKIKNSTSPKRNRNIPHVNNKMSDNIKEEKGANSDKQCDCSKDSNVAEMKQNDSSTETSQFEYVEQDVIDSATQMQKESILVKLTMRIKESEINLNFINKYLQQLSESYKRQIQDMLSMFSGTVKAIRITSEKAAAIDKQQQAYIKDLQHRMKLLSSKIQYLEMGQKNILKQVLELHGFFLILDLIIMSTIFSIFFNKFRRNEYSFK